MAAEPFDIAAELLAYLPSGCEGEQAPYVEALRHYVESNSGRFHVPAHKGGAGAPPLLEQLVGPVLSLDVPSCTRGFDRDVERPPLAEAERLAARAWGARRTWFMVNGASEASHAACLALAHAGGEVLVQRNVHSSTIHGLILAGLRPVFLAPELDAELGIAHGLTADALAAALEATPAAMAAIVVSPTYYGAAADVRGLAEVCHGRGIPLIADEAWGAHFHFHPDLPEDALEAGADLVISGTHKLMGSLTQSAMLHLGAREWPQLDEALLERALGLVRTTSPSSLLMASLDAARAYAETAAAALIDTALDEMRLLREAVRDRCGLDVLDERLAGAPGVAAFDPLRLAIDVRDAPVDGHELARALHRLGNVNLELATDRVAIAHFGIGEPVLERGMRLVAELEAVLDLLHPVPTGRVPSRPPPPPFAEAAMSPRDATFAAHEHVPLAEAVGRVSAESIVVYPPGVANVLPGERFTAELIEYLLATIDGGCELRGTWDGHSAVRVVAMDI
jgi:arginine decarboxylase